MNVGDRVETNTKFSNSCDLTDKQGLTTFSLANISAGEVLVIFNDVTEIKSYSNYESNSTFQYFTKAVCKMIL